MEKKKQAVVYKPPKGKTIFHTTAEEKNLYDILPNIKVKKLVLNNKSTVHLSGPYDEEFPTIPFSHAYGRTTTTYPLDVESCIKQGDPICDSFRIQVNSNVTIFCIADGCGWYNYTKLASNTAKDAFVSYLASKVPGKKLIIN